MSSSVVSSLVARNRSSGCRPDARATRSAETVCRPVTRISPILQLLTAAAVSATTAAQTRNASVFRGAELSLRELLEAPDQRAAALGFFRERLAALTGASR